MRSTTALVTVTTLGASSFLIYKLFFSQPSIETKRKVHVQKRKTLDSPKEKYASLKVRRARLD
jgi:hypothetical protein